MSDALSAPARLLRGFAFDFLSCHDLTVVPRIMDPEYRLTIGGHVLEGRDAVYLPATAAQLEQFPGLTVTVHDVVLGPDVLAMRFTEHGVSRKQGRAAAWGGVTMFKIREGRLSHGWAEEDYFARKRQLATGICDAVKPPHPAPWDGAVEGPDDAAAELVRTWLANPRALCGDTANVDEISAEGPSFAELIAVDGLRVEELFTAGERVAFRVVGEGAYAGGFADVDRALIGKPIALSVAGLLAVRAGRVADVQIAFDRLGLHRSLRQKN